MYSDINRGCGGTFSLFFHKHPILQQVRQPRAPYKSMWRLDLLDTFDVMCSFDADTVSAEFFFGIAVVPNSGSIPFATIMHSSRYERPVKASEDVWCHVVQCDFGQPSERGVVLPDFSVKEIVQLGSKFDASGPATWKYRHVFRSPCQG